MGIIKPRLLRKQCRQRRLKVFCCGPGAEHPLYDFRIGLKKYLESNYFVDVIFGEDLDRSSIRSKPASHDLQTLEAIYAHSVDFTILMLESPGSIAELGTFSMIDNLWPRLYTVVDQSFFEDGSYIARGPLSILSKHSPANVIYYSRSDLDSLLAAFDFPVCLHKYFSYEIPGYSFYTKNIFSLKKEVPETQYLDITNKFRSRFVAKSVLVAINVFQNPTFSELVSVLHLSPDEVAGGLRGLFDAGRIEKTGNGRYRASPPMSSGDLAPFSTTEISRYRARRLAA